MNDESRSSELSQETEGAFMSEEEIKELNKDKKPVDLPMPGEIGDHSGIHSMPEGEVEIMDETGKRVDE